MPGPVARRPFPRKGCPRRRQAEGGHRVGPPVPHEKRVAHPAGAPGGVGPRHAAGGERSAAGAVLPEKAQHAVQLADHGKTALIKALTGIETDRIKEEKKRGITIELGFAYLDLPDGEKAGIIDVPGHEKFVKNMLAGAGGIDLALLVVAADEGVMPQTREHLEICSLLGIKHGLVAVTKIDMVDPELLELAVEDISEFLKGTFLEGAPLFPVSSQTGEGVDKLRDYIVKQEKELA